MPDMSRRVSGNLLAVSFVYANPFAPFIFKKGDISEGFVVDILDACLVQEGLRATYTPAHMNEVPGLLLKGKVDGIAAFAITPERAEEYDFSDAVIVTGAGLFVKKSDDPVFDLHGCKGKKVCTPGKGPLVSYIRTKAPEVIVKTVKDYPAALESVLSGDADAAALNIHAGTNLAREMFPGMFSFPDTSFYSLSLAVAVLKNQKVSLLQHINNGLNKVRQAGDYDKILQKWFASS